VKLIIATKNPGKLVEFAAILDSFGVELASLADYPKIPDTPEDGTTFVENAIIKARGACAYTGFPSLADDSGLMVDALGGLPGIKSARFAPTTSERNAKLLHLLRDVPEDLRTARFVCALALIRPDGFSWTTEGVCEGLITRAPAGSGGFGYDPLFLYSPLGLTFAEIPSQEKNRISHRAQALELFSQAVREEHILG
jgi:XTP/dITP diphosphohydrolase